MGNSDSTWLPAYLRLYVDNHRRSVGVVVVAEVLVEQLVDVGGRLQGDETSVQVGAWSAIHRVRQPRDGQLSTDYTHVGRRGVVFRISESQS